MKTHALSWFEARIGQTIYPIFSERTKKENPALASRKEASGIEIANTQQATTLFNNQVQEGTRYSDERVMA